MCDVILYLCHKEMEVPLRYCQLVEQTRILNTMQQYRTCLHTCLFTVGTVTLALDQMIRRLLRAGSWPNISYSDNKCLIGRSAATTLTRRSTELGCVLAAMTSTNVPPVAGSEFIHEASSSSTDHETSNGSHIGFGRGLMVPFSRDIFHPRKL